MDPPLFHPFVAQEDVHNQGGSNLGIDEHDTLTLCDFLQEYCHINMNNDLAHGTTQAAMPKATDIINIDEDAPRTQLEDNDVVLALRQPSQRDYTKTQEDSTGPVAALSLGMTPNSENFTSTGYNYNVPLPLPLPPRPCPRPSRASSKMFAVAAEPDPLRLSIGTNVPAANDMMMPGWSSSTAFSRYTGSGINLNLPPPETQKKAAAAIPINASPSSKTNKELYERPLLDLIGRKKDHPPFAPVSLECSELSYGAARCKKMRIEPVPTGVAAPCPCVNSMAPAAKAKHKRGQYYTWLANKVPEVDAKIEKLRKEALLRPAHRRPYISIEKDIDDLQRKKNMIHAKMLEVMREDGGEGGSTQQ